MAVKRFFTTLPTRAIGDTALTSLDLRCLAAIALHDGMSGVKKSGGGCFARNSTLAALAQTDVTNFSKSLARLLRAEYVSREPQIMDKRRFTLRVVYDHDSCSGDQQSPPDDVGETAKQSGEIVGEAEGKNPGFSRETEGDYIPLNGELDSVETDKLNSSEEASPCGGAISEIEEADPEEEIEAAEAGHSWVSIKAHLPSNTETLHLGAQVAKIEQAFKAVGSNPDIIQPDERTYVTAWLADIADSCIGGELDAVGQQANRLCEEMAIW